MTLRDNNGVTEYQESRSIDLDYKSLDHALEHLTEEAEGLTDVQLHIEAENQWGDAALVSYLTGWRPATDAEIREDAAKKAAKSKQQRDWEERQAEQLRKARPDLFK